MTPKHRAQHWLLAAVGGQLVIFLMLPVAGLVFSTSWSELMASLAHPLVWPALKLSAFTTATSLLIVVALGTPLSFSLARSQGRASRALETMVQLPIVVPPAVAGVALLLAFGRQGLLGRWLVAHGLSPAFTTCAVIMAEVFVSAPFYVQAATTAFRRMDEDLLIVARTLGATPLAVFFRIALPLARPALAAGALVSWARSLGEFGATLMFAGNLSGKTQTLPLAIYTALESDVRVAQALSLILLSFAFSLLLAVRASFRWYSQATDGAHD